MDVTKNFLGGSSSNNGSTIKGLQMFIADLRSSSRLEDQEKRIQAEIVKIKQYFASASKSGGQDKFAGYQNKKYVAKLAYIYITSNTTKLTDILFGLEQVTNLLNSSVFSEKFMAYMTLEMLYEHEIVANQVGAKVSTQIIRDLSSNDENTIALAINFIGVVGRLKNDIAANEDIVTEVFQLIRSPTTSELLKKKAVLCFLTILKNNRSILTEDLQRQDLWIQRILSMLDDSKNYRLLLAVLPLVEYIARTINSQVCIRLIPQLAHILFNCLMNGTVQATTVEFFSEYQFANTPNPWLITKVVSLLNILIISNSEMGTSNGNVALISDIDEKTLGKLRLCVSKAIELGSRETNNPMSLIVQNTVLYSLINFASKLDPSKEATASSVSALFSLLTSAEINIRYLALDSLVKICAVNGELAINAISKSNLSLIFKLMHEEKDASIVRKIIDLLYTFANVDNVKLIVNQLLKYILTARVTADSKMKQDVSIKVSILTEKYATDIYWFVEISLKLLSLSSNHMAKDDLIWERLCQIVVNNPELHLITCEQLTDYLSSEKASESIIKTSAFLLGEYGNLITDKISIGDLFNLFTDRYFLVSNVTRSMILTTMMKFYKFSPEVGSVVIKFFQLELNSLDMELQSRSYEYLKIIQISKTTNNSLLMDTLFAPLPPFQSKSNPLLKRLGNLDKVAKSQENLESLTLETQASKEVNTNVYSKPGTPTLASPTSFTSMKSTPTRGTPPRPPPSRSQSSMTTNSNKHNPIAEAIVTNGNATNEITTNSINHQYTSQTLTNNWREGFNRSIAFKQGILYSNSLIRILYRVQPVEPENPSTLKISLSIVNQSQWDITGLSLQVIPSKTQDNPNYVISKIEIPSTTTIEPRRKVEHTFQAIIRKPAPLNESPIISCHYNCGNSVNELNLKIALPMTATLTTPSNAATMDLTEFVTKWRKLREALPNQGEHKTTITNIKNHSSQTLTQILQRLGFTVIEQTSMPNTFFVNGIANTKTDGKFGCLLKIKLQQPNDIELIARTTSPGPLSQYLIEATITAMAT